MTKIFVSAVIDAPIKKVWAQVRDFNNLPEWHPKFSRSHIEGGLPSDQIGCIRNWRARRGRSRRFGNGQQIFRAG